MNFKISTYVYKELGVTWPIFWGNRSKIQVTEAHDVCS